MEVKPGYKHTEVGIIPAEWEVASFVSLGSVIDGDRGTNYPGSKDFSIDGHCLFLNAGNVTKSGFVFDDCAFISREKDERLSKGKLIRDDIVLTTRGTVGNFAHFDSKVSFEHIRINSGMVILRNESGELDTAFLYALLQSHFVEKQIERLTFGSAQPQLTVKGINELWIVVPPLLEQRAIATVLSDVDGLLGRLDQFIAKKRDLKQAAMQQLLTGQTRLPGFHGEWKLKKLSELCYYVAGIATSGGDLGYLEIGDVNIETKSYDVAQKEKLSVRGAVIVPAGTLLISTVRPTRGAIVVTKSSLHVSSAFCRVRPMNGLLFHLVCQPIFLAYLGENSIGGTYPTCRDETILGYESLFPSDPAEQTAIAEVLTDMDAELAALEQRREKTRALKQAMMQELLTGNTRFVSPEEAHA